MLHGQDATLEIVPAPPGTGIVFERIDLNPPVIIPGLVSHVIPRARRTTLRMGDATIDTVEHCLSALAGLRVDNAVLRIAGPELPLGDGSALPFLEAMLAVGLVEPVKTSFGRTSASVTCSRSRNCAPTKPAGRVVAVLFTLLRFSAMLLAVVAA